MSDDLFPRKKSVFFEWQKSYIAKVVADPAGNGHTPQEAAALHADGQAYEAAFGSAEKLRSDAATASSQADEKEAGLKKHLRSSVRKVNAIPGVTNAKRVSLGIPPHDGSRSPTPVPTSAPFGRITSDRPLHQNVAWYDDANELSRKKPDGVHFCELWLQIDGTPPVDDTTCKLVKRITKWDYTYTFKPTDVGKTAHWLLRWVSDAAEEGPFGQVVSGRING